MRINESALHHAGYLIIEPEDLSTYNGIGSEVMLGGQVSLLMDVEKLVELCDLLDRKFPKTARETMKPTEPGLYITADERQLLLLDDDGWRALDDDFRVIEDFWGTLTCITNWNAVCDQLGASRLPLTKITMSDINPPVGDDR